MTPAKIAEHATAIVKAVKNDTKDFTEADVRKFLTTLPRQPTGNPLFDAVCEQLAPYL